MKAIRLLCLLLLPALAFAQVQLYAVVNPSGTVVNMVEWDGSTAFSVAPNTLVVATGQANAQIGATFSNGVFTAPAAPAPPQGILFQNSPATGATIALPNAPQPQAVLYCILQPAATIATLTITLPASPVDGDILWIESTQTITTLTVSMVPGQSKINIPNSFQLTANTSQHITWSSQLSSWFRL